MPGPGGPRSAADVLGDLALDQLRTRSGRWVRAAAEQPAARALTEARAPKPGRDRRIVPRVGEQVRGDAVGLDLDLAVELLVAPELTEEALLNSRARQPPPMLEHEVSHLVGEDDRELIVGRLAGQPVIDLD